MLKTTLLTALALLAFAGNSVLCRLALTDNVIDAASFTSIRLFSGSILLVFLMAIKSKKHLDMTRGSWLSACFLYLYAIAFSYSYITLETGVGALVLFGSVQVTMIVVSLLKGKKLILVEWAGLLLAFGGLTTLLLPGTSAPSPIGFALMAISGIAWGFYTLAGRGSEKPLIDTTNNFLRTLPFVAITILFTFNDTQISNRGVILAIVSGAITSGLGYAIWYSVLPSLKVTQAAIIQLAVPIIAAFGGVIFAHEVITTKLLISSMLVLGGVFIVTISKQNSA
ncbi:DMT family transporter [Colwelliaceae bacterium 6471]